MPKVLRIINRFNLGGPTFNATYLTRHLPDDFEILLVGGEKDETEDSSEFIANQLGIEPVIIPEMRREINFKQDRIAYRKIKNLIREFKPDIVHTHASKAGALGRRAAAAEKVPVIVHTFHGHVFHSYFNKVKTAFYKYTERYLASKSTSIIAISERQKHELTKIHKICSPDKVTVIPLGFDLDKFQENAQTKRESFRSKFGLEEDEIAVGIIGRLVPIKNHELFLKGAQKVLANTDKKIRFFIVGDGEERKRLQDLCSQLSLSYDTGIKPSKQNVIFTSWIKDIDWVNAGVDIVTLTSKNEGTPVSLIEAQAANKPIVSTRVGGIENIVKPNDTAILCDSNNMEQYSSALLEMIENESLRNQMSTNGWDFVKENFHYTRLVSDMAEHYHSLLNNR